jgi:hypothetical protein
MGVLGRAQPESSNFFWVWHGQIDHSCRLHNALWVARLIAVRAEGKSQGLHHKGVALLIAPSPF